MSLYQDTISNLMNELKEILKNNLETEQIKNMTASLHELSLTVQQVSKNFTLQFFSEEVMEYIAEAKESEKLSQSDFESKYSYEMDICRKLGRAGWVVSEYSNPREVKEWYQLLSNGKSEEITTYFEGDNDYILTNIIHDLEHTYCENPNQRYFNKAVLFYEQEDYMTSAIYLVALIEYRTDRLMNYPKGTKYRQKYSMEGFENHLQTEFNKANAFFTKRFLFLEMYPSIIEFLNRLFVDGEYTFEKKVEPPYINRNWILHGRSSRLINRYECIQLFNALSVIEFVFSIGKS